MTIIENFKKFFKIGIDVATDEIEEMKDLVITDEDKQQGEIAANLAVAAMGSMGMPCPEIGRRVMIIAFSYVIRNAKDGMEDTDKLIISRIVNEVKESLKAKKEEEEETIEKDTTI